MNYSNKNYNYKKRRIAAANTHSHITSLKNLKIVGYMSVDVNRQYHSDLSQLKFVSSCASQPVSFDLNHNISSAVKRTTDEKVEKIDLLLKFVLDKYDLLKEYVKPNFVTYRRTLISVMCSAYRTSEAVHLVASYFNGSIYLCSLESPQETSRRQYRSQQEEKFCAWGYKFEQYILSDSPKSEPNINTPVIENEEFSLFYNSKLGEHNILYGAQIDGTLADTSDIPDTSVYNNNIDYLRRNTYVELKTNREIEHYRQEQNFKRYKLLRCWCQCYLAGLKGLLVGFRNDDGIVHRLQWFDTQKIPQYCRNEWDPQTALDFLEQTLSYIKKCFEHCENEGRPVSYKFMITNGEINKSNICDREEILPKWYTEKIINVLK